MEVRMSRMMRHYRDWDYDNISAYEKTMEYKLERDKNKEQHYQFVLKVIEALESRLNKEQMVAVSNLFSKWRSSPRIRMPQGTCVFTQIRNAVNACVTLEDKPEVKADIHKHIDDVQLELQGRVFKV